MSKPRVIAFYLPQFHPTPENDMWWGPGFTEWTNVAKARPLYLGHKQPHLPANLGFYDLRLSQTREDQASMAREAGIEGFCYWHYWIEGTRLLDIPFKEVLGSGRPDFPFCLAWANHSWHKYNWSGGNKHFIGSRKNKVLIKQTYGGVPDYENHFYALLDAFRDSRYIKVDDRLLFMIYDGLNFKDFHRFSEVWKKLAEKEGLPGFYFITHACVSAQIDNLPQFIEEGYDAVNVSLHRMPFKSECGEKKLFLPKLLTRIHDHFSFVPEVVSYSNAIEKMDGDVFDNPKVIPTIVPNWDHTPRSGCFGRVFHDCRPDLFRRHIDMIFKRLKNKSDDEKIVFVKSWNEWGEGNYLEPDIEYGMERLNELKEAIETFE